MRVDIVAKSKNKSFAGAKTEVFVHLLQKVVGFQRAKPFGRLPQKAESRVELVQLLSSGAFAGEFFNPNFGLKKRGLL